MPGAMKKEPRLREDVVLFHLLSEHNTDYSGLILKDEKDKDPYTIPEGTKIHASGFLVIKQDDSGTNGSAFSGKLYSRFASLADIQAYWMKKVWKQSLMSLDSPLTFAWETRIIKHVTPIYCG